MTRKDREIIGSIAARASLLTKCEYDVLTSCMDLYACHRVNSLNLEKLLASKEFDFLHDVLGINRHLDHETGELKDCFWPRCGGRE